MSRTLVSDFSDLSIDANIPSRQVADSASVERVNPWKSRVITPANAEAVADRPSTSTVQSHDPTAEGSNDKLFEADAWPEPSVPFEHRATVAGSGVRIVDEKPRAKKLGRKWQNIEIEFGNGRSGARMSSGVVNSSHHSSSSSMISSRSSTVNSVDSSSITRGGVGGNRRAGSTTNNFNRGRGGRHINGYYQARSPSHPDQSVVQETFSDASETGSSVVTTAAFVGSVPRGGYSSRGRRNGSRGVSQPVSVATASAAQAIPPFPSVGPVVYFPNVVLPAPGVFPIPPPTIPTTTDTAVVDANAASLQAAILLSQPSPQACLYSSEPISPSAPSRLREAITLDKLLEFISEYGWSKVQIPSHFRRNPTVAMALQVAELSTTTRTGDEIAGELSGGDTPGLGEKREDVIVVDGRFYFVPLNSHLTKFLKFHSKQDYIRHHVEYYFSEVNLQRDDHLIKLMSMNKNSCPVGPLLSFNRLRYANTNENELIEAVMSSSTVGIVYDDQQQVIGVAPQNSVPQTTAATSAHSSSTDSAAQSSIYPSDLHQPKSSEVESPQVLLPMNPVSALPFMLPNGAAVSSVPGLQPNGSHIFQTPQFIPYSSVPPLPLYYNNTTPLPGVATGAAGDHAATMNASGTENANMYYRPIWPNPTSYSQPPGSFIPYFAPQHQPFYVSLLSPTAAGLAPAVASAHNSVPRTTGAFLPASIAASNAQLPTQQQRTFVSSVRAPHRSPNHRPIGAESKVVDETESTP